jgi:hypothetical protein
LVKTPRRPRHVATVDEKSQQVIDHAIQVLGGQSYLNVNSVVGKGFYTGLKSGHLADSS